MGKSLFGGEPAGSGSTLVRARVLVSLRIFSKTSNSSKAILWNSGDEIEQLVAGVGEVQLLLVRNREQEVRVSATLQDQTEQLAHHRDGFGAGEDGDTLAGFNRGRVIDQDLGKFLVTDV